MCNDVKLILKMLFNTKSVKRTIIFGESLIIELKNGKQLEFNNISFDDFIKILTKLEKNG